MPFGPDCAVPNLTTSTDAPVLAFESRLLERAAEIEAWFRRQWQVTPPPFYASVDLRNAGFKLAPVDTNLFPAGFNNLNPAFEPLCVQAIQSAFERIMPSACDVLLVPESHTRNRFYLESVALLQELIRKAGYRVELGSPRSDLHGPETMKLDSGRELVLQPLLRDDDRVSIERFTPCVVLLNNDLSGGRPAILENLSQPVIPPLALGWSNRSKTQHFTHYRDVAREFGALLEIDPWWVDPLFRNCGQINFKTGDGEECLASNVDLLLQDIRAKYGEYGVKEEPFVIVKADAGTYGMGVLTVRNGEDVRKLNRSARKKMTATKEGREITGVIIQEGVYTFERWVEEPRFSESLSGSAESLLGLKGATAEPVVYMIDHFVVGGFYRVHAERGIQDNLNAPGASFRPLAFAEAGNCPDLRCGPHEHPNRFYAYGVVARLALLAAAREVAQALLHESLQSGRVARAVA
ncbi:MAG: glutamate--cysteine ligase [Gammaproteobacteria bacterium]|nr:glutamate--cysteine ligase [Gammaproteobacteria bacterium]